MNIQAKRARHRHDHQPSSRDRVRPAHRANFIIINGDAATEGAA
jgi:hypothetical protein